MQKFNQEQKYRLLTVKYSTALGQFDLTYTVEAEQAKSLVNRLTHRRGSEFLRFSVCVWMLLNLTAESEDLSYPSSIPELHSTAQTRAI